MDMNITNMPAAMSPVPSAPAQEKNTAASSGAAKTPSKDVVDLTDIGLCKIVSYNNDSPLGARLLGYGTVSVNRSDSTQYRYGNMKQHFSVHCDWTYVDLVNHTITRTVSHGEGINYSDEASGTRVSAFAGVTASVTFSAERYFTGQLDDVADTLTASREIMAQQLKNTLSGSDLEQRLIKLEDIYSKSREQAEDSFADMLAQLADRDSKSELIDKARRSVRSLFTAYEARYRSLSAGIKFDGEADLYELTAQLRRLSASARFEHRAEKGLYSLRELDFAAVSVSAFRAMVSAAAQGGGGSEARQAMSVSFTAMRIEAMSSRSLIGGGMAGLLRSGVQGLRDQLLEAMDGYLSSRREKGGSEEEYPAGDAGLYDGVYRRVMDAFGMTGDAMSSLREGAQEARALLSAPARLAALRFSAEISVGGYWDSFDGKDYRAGVYSYARQWESLTAELEAGSVKVRA